MTDPVKVAETCRCGSSTSVEADGLEAARRVVSDWRRAHRCDPVDERDRGRTGATSVLPGPGRIGFGAAPDAVGPIRW